MELVSFRVPPQLDVLGRARWQMIVVNVVAAAALRVMVVVMVLGVPHHRRLLLLLLQQVYLLAVGAGHVRRPGSHVVGRRHRVDLVVAPGVDAAAPTVVDVI